MFTGPDQNDAVATVPAFAPVGPNPSGFFADCNPGQNFPGTRPIAEHFNEQILNNHNLLAEAGITAPIKGDRTLLTRGMRAARFIRQNATFFVAPGGSATPTNPWAGDAFNTIASALAWLRLYRIAENVGVALNVAAGTYEHSATVTVQHPDGGRITIQGAGVGVTVLHFTGCTGLLIPFGALGALRTLTLRGDGIAGPKNGINITGTLGLDTVTVENFGGIGVCSVNGNITGFGQLTFQNNSDIGLYFIGGSTCGFMSAVVLAQGNMSSTGANVSLWGGAQADFADLTCAGGQRALSIGRCSGANILKLNVSGATKTSDAVDVMGNSYLTATGATAGAWIFAAGQTLKASQNGFVYAATALGGGTATSPAINTLGNQGGYISTVAPFMADESPDAAMASPGPIAFAAGVVAAPDSET